MTGSRVLFGALSFALVAGVVIGANQPREGPKPVAVAPQPPAADPGRVVATLEVESHAERVTFAPDGKLFVVYGHSWKSIGKQKGADGKVRETTVRDGFRYRVYDAATRKLVHDGGELKGDNHNLLGFAGPGHLATLTLDDARFNAPQVIEFWDARTGERRRALELDREAGTWFQPGTDGKGLFAKPTLRHPVTKDLIGGARFDVRSATTGAFAYTAFETAAEVRSWHLSADGTRLFVHEKGGASLLIDTKSGKTLWAVENAEAPTSVRVAPDGRLVVWSTLNGPVHVWDGVTGKELPRWEDSDCRLLYTTFSGDGKLFAAYTAVRGQPQDVLRVWDTGSGKLLHTSDTGTQFNLAFAPDRPLLAVIRSKDRTDTDGGPAVVEFHDFGGTPSEPARERRP